MEQMTEEEELKMFWESELHYLLMLLEDHKKDVLDKLPKGKDLYGEKRLNKSLTKKIQLRYEKCIGRSLF
jgi:hypothetical protein